MMTPDKTLRERLLHAVLYEVCAMALLVPLGSWLLDAGLGHVGVLALLMSSIAMSWNMLFNALFERLERRAGWQRTESAAAAAGWRWPASVAFDRSRLQPALDALAAADGPLRACGLLRGKGVFRTSRAWYAWQWVDGRARWDETAWRADSRLEVLTARPIDLQAVDDALRAVVATG